MIKLERDVKRLFGVSAAQASIVLRAYESADKNHRLVPVGGDRTKTIARLVADGYFADQPVGPTVDRATANKEIAAKTKKAKELLPANWRDAFDLLKECHALARPEDGWTERRLTQKGVELAEKMKAAGYNYNRVRFGTE
jgi:hypothetical protein